MLPSYTHSDDDTIKLELDMVRRQATPNLMIRVNHTRLGDIWALVVHVRRSGLSAGVDGAIGLIVRFHVF